MVRTDNLIMLLVCVSTVASGGCGLQPSRSETSRSSATKESTDVEVAEAIQSQWRSAKYLIIEEYVIDNADDYRRIYIKSDQSETRTAPTRVLLVVNRNLITTTAKHLRITSVGGDFLYRPRRTFRVFIIGEPDVPRVEFPIHVMDLKGGPLLLFTRVLNGKDVAREFVLRDRVLFSHISKWFDNAPTIDGVCCIEYR